MKKIFMLSAFLLATILTTTASAANWVFAFDYPNYGEKFFIDSDSIALDRKNSNERQFSVTVKIECNDAEVRKEYYDDAAFAVAYYEFKEVNKKIFFKLIDAKFYDSNGKVKKSVDIDEDLKEWYEIINDGTEGEADFYAKKIYDASKKYLK